MVVGWVWALISGIISFSIFLISIIFQSSNVGEKEGNTTFECGIDPLLEKRVFLFLHFFLIGILFIVFDLELAVILPLVITPPLESGWGSMWEVVLFLMFVGLVVEMEMGTLDWNE